MMNLLYERIIYLFDSLHLFWEHEKMNRKIAVSLIILFLASLLVIELNRQGLLPSSFAASIPTNHFHAIEIAFVLVLTLEIISLVFTLPCSFSKSVGKQFEILALIFMRNGFKELSSFPEPISYVGNEERVLHILSDGFGALCIFALLGLYYLVQKKENKESMKSTALFGYIAAKKGIALVLLFTFLFMGGRALFQLFTGVEHYSFFHDFYTILIITDILLVLIAQSFQPSFYAMFRNSGYALSTLIIRIALTAPVYFNVVLGLLAAIFAILLTVISNKLFGHEEYDANL